MATADHSLDPERLKRLTNTIASDIAAQRYDGAVVVVAHRGQVALHEAVGFAERSSERPAALDDVFHLFSVTKTFTATAILQCIDRGSLMLTTPVAEIIPEFAANGKQRVTVAHLLTHRSGLPPDLPFITPDQLGDITAVTMAVCGQALIARPGESITYSPIGGFAVLGELVRRLDERSRSLAQILDEDLFGPLEMRDTSLTLRSDLDARRSPVVVRDPNPGIFPAAALESINVMHSETFEMPGGGAIGTARDLFRWAEGLRICGAPGGSRILSRALFEFAMRDHTGSEPNHIYDSMCESRGWGPYPSHLGLGFFLRGEGIFTTPFGLTASPSTFGGLGAGSTIYWVDPERELVFVCLTTGTLEDSRNFERLQQLSDLALSTVA
jgi:CubicO group peptidase (beta-lactamase class C family)